MRLKDKVVVVTGGGRGIGRAIALAHAAEGARLAVLSRTESDLEETVGLIAGLAGAVLAVPVDGDDGTTPSNADRHRRSGPAPRLRAVHRAPDAPQPRRP